MSRTESAVSVDTWLVQDTLSFCTFWFAELKMSLDDFCLGNSQVRAFSPTWILVACEECTWTCHRDTRAILFQVAMIARSFPFMQVSLFMTVSVFFPQLESTDWVQCPGTCSEKRVVENIRFLQLACFQSTLRVFWWFNHLSCARPSSGNCSSTRIITGSSSCLFSRILPVKMFSISYVCEQEKF